MTQSLETLIDGEVKDLNLHKNLTLGHCLFLVTSYNGLPTQHLLWCLAGDGLYGEGFAILWNYSVLLYLAHGYGRHTCY